VRRRRHQTGSIKKRCGKWVGQWWEDGNRRNRVLGAVSELTKSDAQGKLETLLAELRSRKQQRDGTFEFGGFVEQVYFPFYRRKWKRSTASSNENRVSIHLTATLGRQALQAFRREDLQTLLDGKAATLGFSVLDHLRWDLKQIFDMAVAEGLVARNPAALLFTPKSARRGVRRVMSFEEVKKALFVLELRERLIVKLAILAGMRPGEIFALTWAKMSATYADITVRVYKGEFDTPKTAGSVRKAALSKGVLAEIEAWRAASVATGPADWVFPSERLRTPLAKDNCWRRIILPRFQKVGLGWANFQVLRRTHSTLMNALGVEPKLVADQLGHSLDVNQNIYTQVSVERRQNAVEQLESAVVM
jgi:integrase